MIKMIGVLIIIIGFMLKIDTVSVIIIAALATGLVSGLEFTEFLTILGQSFFDNRYISIFLVSLPVIGMLERNGLKNTATRVISKIEKATINSILNIYTFSRILMTMFGVRLGGHIQFVRPVLYPMLDGVAKKQKDFTQKKQDTLKGISCAVDNYANFFGQNVFIANAGVLLIEGTLSELGVKVSNVDIALHALVIAVCAMILSVIQNFFISRSFKGGL